jgi:hypothetical protein
MGLSPWKTWLLKANGPKFLGKHDYSRQMGPSFHDKMWFPHVPCCLGQILFLKEFLGSFASSPRKTLGSNTPSPLTTCFNLFSLFKQLGQHNEPNCTMINAFPWELSSRKYSQVLLEKHRLNPHSPWGVIQLGLRSEAKLHVPTPSCT